MGKLEEQKRLAAGVQSQHFGEVGQRLDFNATLMNVFPHESQFGVTYITKMVTDKGEIVTWFASNDPEAGSAEEAAKEGLLFKGVMSKVTGTIKKHDDFKGQKIAVPGQTLAGWLHHLDRRGYQAGRGEGRLEGRPQGQEGGQGRQAVIPHTGYQGPG